MELEIETRKKGICWQNVLSCCTVPLEGVFFFGTLAGWPNLAEIYKTLGVYGQICNRNDSLTTNGTFNCPERDVIFTTAGTLGGLSMNVGPLLCGYILDRFGILWSRCLCTALLTVGLLFLMFTEEVHWFMFIGIILYSGGTLSLLLTNYPLADLFPTITGFIMVCGQVVFLVSGSWFRIWSFLFSSGVGLKGDSIELFLTL